MHRRDSVHYYIGGSPDQSRRPIYAVRISCNSACPSSTAHPGRWTGVHFHLPFQLNHWRQRSVVASQSEHVVTQVKLDQLEKRHGRRRTRHAIDVNAAASAAAARTFGYISKVSDLVEGGVQHCHVCWQVRVRKNPRDTVAFEQQRLEALHIFECPRDHLQTDAFWFPHTTNHVSLQTYTPAAKPRWRGGRGGGTVKRCSRRLGFWLDAGGRRGVEVCAQCLPV